VREFVLSADLRIIVGMQAWRWAGFGFLTLYTYGVLPGIFAWPAGLGDMAIGVTAPLVLSALLRRPGFAASKSFVAWNVSGILDLTVAVSIGALVPLLAPNFYGAVSTAPMTQLPLVLVLDTALDCAVSGATSRQIGNALIRQKSQTCPEVPSGMPAPLSCNLRHVRFEKPPPRIKLSPTG
jgi:hypothetical protein